MAMASKAVALILHVAGGPAVASLAVLSLPAKRANREP